MAESKQFRQKFYWLNAIFLALLVAVLTVLSLTADRTSGLKLDLTRDKLYSISPPTRSILDRLKDELQVTYYCSEELPSFLANMLRDTADMFEEFRKLSGGKFTYEIVNPDQLADTYALEKCEAYLAKKDEVDKKKAKPEDLDALEPEMPRSVMQAFGPRKGPGPKELRDHREERARIRAKETNKSKEDAVRTILLEEFKQQRVEQLGQDGVQPYVVQDRTGNSVRQVRVYSSIRVSYLERDPELIPFHSSLEGLEYELAQRIVKLTTPEKPTVAIFDARKPPSPPFNPAMPMQQPQSDHSGITNYLRQFVEVRELALKENDALDDLVRRLKEDRERREREKKGEDEPKDAEAKKDAKLTAEDYKLVTSLVVAQPDNLEDRQVYEISRAISLGIPTIFLVSPFSLDVSQPGLDRGIPIGNLRPGLDELFSKWGVSLGDEMLASNESGQIAVAQRLRNSTFMVQQMTPLAAILAPRGGDINQSSGLTNRIPGLVFPASVAIRVDQKVLDANKLVFEGLVSTSKESWSVKIDPLASAQNPFNRGRVGATIGDYIEDLARPKDPERFADFAAPQPVMAYVSGRFPFLYQDQTVPAWRKEEAKDGSGEGPGGGLPAGHPGVPGFPGDGDLILNPEDPAVAPPAGGEAPAAAPAPAVPAAEVPPAAAPSAAAPSAAAPSAAAPSAAAPSEPTPPAAAPVPGTPAAAPAADGSAKPAETESPPAEKAHVDVAEGKVLLIASADMLRDDFLQHAQSFQPYLFNAEFFQNAVQLFSLKDSDALIKIRRKTLALREFKEGSKERSRPIEILNIFGVPVVVGIFGLLRYVLRRQSSVGYERRWIEDHASKA